jgi:hypothetical protein
MRRIAALAALGLTMLAVTACGDTKEPTTTAPTTAATTAAATSAAPSGNTDAACEQFKTVFAQDRMTQVGVPVGQLLAYRNAKDSANAKKAETKVKAEFDKLAADITKIGTDSGDPAFQAKMDAVVAEINKSKDLAFLDDVKDVGDLEKPFTEMLTAWILPIATTCDLT